MSGPRTVVCAAGALLLWRGAAARPLDARAPDAASLKPVVDGDAMRGALPLTVPYAEF